MFGGKIKLALATLLVTLPLLFNNCEQPASESLSQSDLSSVTNIDANGSTSGPNGTGGVTNNGNGSGYSGTKPLNPDDRHLHAEFNLTCTTQIPVLLSSLSFDTDTETFLKNINTCAQYLDIVVDPADVWHRDYCIHFRYTGGKIWYLDEIMTGQYYNGAFYMEELCYSDTAQVSFSINYKNTDGQIIPTLFLSQATATEESSLSRHKGNVTVQADGSKIFVSDDGTFSISISAPQAGKASASFDEAGSMNLQMSCLIEGN